MTKEITEVYIDLETHKLLMTYDDLSTDEVILPQVGFLKIIGSGPFRDVLLWKSDKKAPIKKPKRRKKR